MNFQATLNPYLALIHSSLHSSNSSVWDIVLQIYTLAHSDTPQCRTPLHTRLLALCMSSYVYGYVWVCMHAHMHIHMYSLRSTMTGSCHVCWSQSLPWLFSPWQLCNIHFKFLAISTQLFCTQTWYRLFTPCCSKYSSPNIQCIWLFKGNWSGGLILLSQLPI
jgi:hypothetical protein